MRTDYNTIITLIFIVQIIVSLIVFFFNYTILQENRCRLEKTKLILDFLEIEAERLEQEYNKTLEHLRVRR